MESNSEPSPLQIRRARAASHALTVGLRRAVPFICSARPFSRLADRLLLVAEIVACPRAGRMAPHGGNTGKIPAGSDAGNRGREGACTPTFRSTSGCYHRAKRPGEPLHFAEKVAAEILRGSRGNAHDTPRQIRHSDRSPFVV